MTMSKGIYVHIPFCVRKCLYCDFCSEADTRPREAYVKELIEEIKQKKGIKADSVFIGGGTPSVLGDKLLRIIEALGEYVEIEDGAEFTVEVNPGTVDVELLQNMRNLGVNRLSIGAQSFNDNELKALGRIHTAAEIYAAASMAEKAGFDNINLDIMLSTPYQTLKSVKKTLAAVKEINPPHVSAYSLIIEEGTPFEKMELPLSDEDEEREIYYETVDFLAKMGLERYEISNFAKTGFECKHNIKYWTGRDYVGLGAAAHSYDGGVRYQNTNDIEEYIAGKGRGINAEIIDNAEREKERFLLGLRMTRGVEYHGEFKEIIADLEQKGLLEEKDGRVMLTKRGIDVGNIVFMEFV